MFGINKGLIATSAAIATMAVFGLDMTQSHSAPTLSPAAIVSARFPTAAEMMFAPPQAEQATKGDKGGAECAREHWPYIADECLARRPANRPTRTITIQRQIAANASQAAQVPVTQLAAR